LPQCSLYLAFNHDEFPRTDAVVLWVMTGVVGLVTVIVVLLINRRRPLSPWLVLGLLPMAASAYWVLS
jgi:hypothetical protein